MLLNSSSKLTKLLASLLVAFLLLSTLIVVAAPLANAAPAPNPFARASAEKVWDGTGFDTPGSATFVNTTNGFHPGDDGPDDGVVSSSDTVGYAVTTNLEAGPERTVQIVFNLPEYLTYNASLNANLCTSTQFAKATATTVNGSPACNYEIKRGTPLVVQNQLVLTAKDTAGTAQYDQVLKVTTGLVNEGVYSSFDAEPVTVVSAPAADVVIRPSTCTVSGSCNSLPTTTTTGSLYLMVQPLKREGYSSTKGASTTTNWWGTLDVSEFPAGTTFSIGSTVLTNNNGTVEIPSGVGQRIVTFNAPSEWGGDFAEGESRSYAAHISIPTEAFSTNDYLNNSDGWQPGTGNAASFNTYNERQTGARKGYVLANNDFTSVSVYRAAPEPPGLLFGKTLYRPYTATQTLWEPGNLSFADGTKTTVTTVGANPKWKMAPGTELYSELYVLTNRAETETLTNVVISDQWDINLVTTDNMPAPVVTDPNGNVVTSGYTLQWSRTASGQAVSDPNIQNGWIASDTPVPGAKAVRAIFSSLPAGTAAGAGKYTLGVYSQVISELEEPAIPVVTSDTLYGYCDDCTGEGGIVRSVNIVTMPSPIAGMTLTPSTAVLNSETNKITYTAVPTVTDLQSSSDVINGTITLNLDPCVTDYTLNNVNWVVVSEEMSGNCEDGTGSNTVVLTLAEPFTPSNNLVSGKTTLPRLEVELTYSRLTTETATTNATFDLTSIDGPQQEKLPVASVDKSAVVTITPQAVGTGVVNALTPKVERDGVLEWEAVVYSSSSGTKPGTETVVALPVLGAQNADYLDILESVSGNTTYRDSGEPLESSYSGSWTLTSATVDTKNSVAGTSVLCTTDAVVSLDPSVNTWSSTCGPNTTGLKVVQTGGDNQGVSTIKFSLQTEGNTKDDVYLTWISGVVGASTSADMAWPANEVIVSSEISGYTYWDITGRGMDYRDGWPTQDEITVELLDSTGKVIATTVTGPSEEHPDWEPGYYEFTNLHSGKYQTRIPAIGINGGFPTTMPSKYYPDRTIDVLQTFSYRAQKLANAKTTSTEINLGVEAIQKNVNYGFTAPDPYSDLKKDAAKVNCVGDSVICDVSWDITVKNGGTPFESGEILEAIGNHPESNGSAVWTTDGYYIVKSNGTVTKATGITGTILGATGGSPASNDGSGVWTTDGYYIVNSIGTATQATGITGEILGAIGNSPASGNGSAVWTTDGYYIVKSNGTVTKATGITGEILEAIGNSPASSLNGSAVWTTDGYYIVKSNGTVTKATGITGTILGATGGSPASNDGSGVWTTDGYYIVKSNGEAINATGITGEILGATGYYPYRNNDGSAVWTIDGYYIVSPTGTATRVDIPLPEVPEFTGTPVTLTGGKLTDSTSKEVYDVTATTGARIIQLIGTAPSSVSGSGVVLSNGDYIIMPGVGARNPVKADLPVSSKVVSAVGKGPVTTGSGVVTSKGGYFIVKGSGETIKADLPAGSSVVQVIGETPTTGSGVVLDDGSYYLVDGVGGTLKAAFPENIKVVEALGVSPLASNYGSGAITADGSYWLVSSAGIPTKVNLPEGVRVTSAIGSHPSNTGGSAVVSSDGRYFIVESADVVHEVVFPGGEAVTSAYGSSPANPSSGSGVIADGSYWVVRSATDIVKADIPTASTVETVLTLYPQTNGSTILLDNGEVYFVGPYNAVEFKLNLPGPAQSIIGTGTYGAAILTNGDLYLFAGYSETKASLPEGSTVLQAVGSSSIGASLSDGGYYLVFSDGSSARTGLDLESRILTPSFETLEGNFITRGFNLPNLDPGEEVTVTLTGKVNKPNFEANGGKGLVIGNQAWETFNQTPRSTPTLPQPALPAWNAADPLAYGKWTGNPTCSATPSWVVPGDQCDQVYASVPTTDQELGALAGYLWFDENRDGVMDESEPRLINAKVTLYHGENGGFTTKMGETLTNDEGYYDFTSLVPSSDLTTDGYYVVFSPESNPELSTGENLLEPGQSWWWTAPYDQTPFFAVDRSASFDGLTRNLAVTGSQTTQPVNGGVVLYNAGINVEKGYVNSEGAMSHEVTPELDADNPGYTVTTPVTVIAKNTGTENLNSLTFTDETLSGANVTWQQCSIVDTETTVDVSSGVWENGVFSFAFDPTLTLAPNETLSCIGELEAFAANTTLKHENTVTIGGTGSMSGIPVLDDSEFTANPPDSEMLPEPKITLEKGVLTSVSEDVDCSVEANAKNPALCAVDAGPVEVGINKSTTVTFRITNTGEDTLLDMTLEDATTIGDYDVEDITCDFPTASINGQLRRVLTPGATALCSGTLTVVDVDSTHGDEATVFAVGQVSRELVSDEATFEAYTPVGTPPVVTLPLSGGTGAWWYYLGGLLIVVLAVGLTLRVRSIRRNALSKD